MFAGHGAIWIAARDRKWAAGRSELSFQGFFSGCLVSSKDFRMGVAFSEIFRKFVFIVRELMYRPVLHYCLISALLLFIAIPRVYAQVFPPEVKRVADDFVCQCGCNHQLSACGMVNCGSAIPLQEEIQSYLKQGKTRQEIKDIFISKYGKLILSAPTTQGFDLTAWTMPFVMLFLGLLLVYFLIKAWVRRKPALAIESTSSGSSVPDIYQQQIEKELKDFDS